MIMKKIPVWMPLIVLMACAGGATANMAQAASIANIQGRDWLLVELRRGSEITRIDRTGAADDYSIRFNPDQLTGRAAPNRYFGPYTSGEGQALNIEQVASTLMASLFEREDLREGDYFNYLRRVSRWELRDGNLELHSSAENGNEAVLVFREN